MENLRSVAQMNTCLFILPEAVPSHVCSLITGGVGKVREILCLLWIPFRRWNGSWWVWIVPPVLQKASVISKHCGWEKKRKQIVKQFKALRGQEHGKSLRRDVHMKDEMKTTTNAQHEIDVHILKHFAEIKHKISQIQWPICSSRWSWQSTILPGACALTAWWSIDDLLMIYW